MGNRFTIKNSFSQDITIYTYQDGASGYGFSEAITIQKGETSPLIGVVNGPFVGLAATSNVSLQVLMAQASGYRPISPNKIILDPQTNSQVVNLWDIVPQLTSFEIVSASSDNTTVNSDVQIDSKKYNPQIVQFFNSQK
jgi:hypothetical protein